VHSASLQIEVRSIPSSWHAKGLYKREVYIRGPIRPLT
jgi:hypothetical protein